MAVASKTRRVFDNRYEILAIVGRGSASVVYHARHLSTPSSEIALKVLVDQRHETTNSDRLRKEALAMVSCRHKNILRLDDFHSVGSLSYLCLEYAPESDLRKYVTKLGGSLGAKQAELFMSQVADGLSYIHKAGIIHRDIKPDNILVINHREIRICDFGIALLPGEQSSLDELQAGVGTMSYMAPEILDGREYDHRADIYALGLSMYEMISGIHPFDQAPLMKQLEVRQDDKIAPLSSIVPEVPEYLSQIIAKALRFNPEDRFQTAREIVKSIEAKEVIDLRKPKNLEPEPEPIDIGPDPIAEYSASIEEPTNEADISFGDNSSYQETVPLYMAPEPLAEAAQSVSAESAESSMLTSSEPPPPPPESESIDLAPIAEEPSTPPVDAPFEENFGSDNPVAEEPMADPFTTQQTIPGVPFEDLMAGEGASKYFVNTSSPTREISAAEIAEFRKFAQVDPEPAHDVISTDINSSPQDQLANTPPPEANLGLPNSKTVTGYAVIVGLMLAGLVILILKLRAVNTDQGQELTAANSDSATVETDNKFLPVQDSTSPLKFPALPGGTYKGTITRLIADETLPFSIISFPESRTLVVMIGIDGWTPAVVSLDKAIRGATDPNEAESIRVSSNGFVLNLTGKGFGTEGLETQINGTFLNVITGETGPWTLTPEN